MRINRITLKNFRNIGEIEKSYAFNTNFTVVIGINGKGKSTILHALRVACGAFFLAIPDVKKRHIAPDEIRQKDVRKQLIPQRPVKVEAEGEFDESENGIIWRRQILEQSNSTTSNEADIGVIKRIGQLKFQKITKEENDKIALPVIAFFGTSRAHGAGRNRASRIGRQIFKEGYQDWYEMKSTTFKYENWLSSYDILKRQGKEYNNTKKAFFDTLKRANPYIVEADAINGKLWLKVKIEDIESDFLPLDLLSDGIRFYTEMVAEIAYRCIVLNGFYKANATLLSDGIVMIDELDLHLHPNWQKEVVKDLKNAFPKIQFVVTTHSPFIVQSLENNELINLDLETDVSPKDLSLEVVAEEIMNVRSAYSSENEALENLSLDYFKILEEADKSDEKDVYKSKLVAFENAIEDPGLRAFLKSNRIAKNII